MNTKLDDRSLLMKMLESLDEDEFQRILTFAAGYEAGKISQLPLDTSTQPRKPPEKTA